MTTEEAKEAVRLYISGECTLNELAKRFNISTSWMYQMIMGGRRGVDGVSDSFVRRMHFKRNYIIKDDQLYKQCKKCAKVLLVSKKNFYFTTKGLIKYSLCKECFKLRVKIERMIRKDLKSKQGKVGGSRT